MRADFASKWVIFACRFTYCSRFIFAAVNEFELACIRTLLTEVLLDGKIIDKIKRGEGSIDFLLCLSESGTADYDVDAAKAAIEDILSFPLKLPLTISPYCIPGGRRDIVYEMIDMADFMMCYIMDGASEEDASFVQYAQSADIPVHNLRDFL